MSGSTGGRPPGARFEVAGVAAAGAALADLRGAVTTRRPRVTRRSALAVDTLDWRLRRAGMTLTLETRDDRPWLVLDAGERGPRHRLQAAAPPRVAADLPPGPLRAAVAAAAGPARLRPIVAASGSRRSIDVLDERRKTVARVHLDRLDARRPGGGAVALPPTLTVERLRGFEAAGDVVVRVLAARHDPTDATELDTVLAAVGRAPLDTIAPLRWPSGSDTRTLLAALVGQAAAPLRLAAMAIDGPDDAGDDPALVAIARGAAGRLEVVGRRLVGARRDDRTVAAARAIARAARRLADAGRLAELTPADAPFERRLADACGRRRVELAATLSAPLGLPGADAADARPAVARLAVALARAWAAVLDPGRRHAPSGGRSARRAVSRLDRLLTLLELAGPLTEDGVDADEPLQRVAEARDAAERLRSAIACRRLLGSAGAGEDHDLPRRLAAERTAARERLAAAIDRVRRSRDAVRVLAAVGDLAGDAR